MVGDGRTEAWLMFGDNAAPLTLVEPEPDGRPCLTCLAGSICGDHLVGMLVWPVGLRLYVVPSAVCMLA